MPRLAGEIHIFVGWAICIVFLQLDVDVYTGTKAMGRVARSFVSVISNSCHLFGDLLPHIDTNRRLRDSLPDVTFSSVGF